jgi:hypothetical protein
MSAPLAGGPFRVPRDGRLPVALFSILLLSSPAPALAEWKPFAWAGLGPKSVIVGQPVTLTVDVFVPNGFTGAPKFPPLDVKDAVVVFLEEGGVNLTQDVNGQTYAGQRRQYLIYPQRAGEFAVPPFEVRVSYAIDAKPSAPTAVPAQAGSFTATIPEAAKGLGYFVATPAFNLTATSDRPIEGLKVGDSLTRAITMTASDAFAIMLPPLSFPPVDGLAVYPAQPSLSDTGGTRGEPRVARRAESVTFVFQKEGSYRLPPIEIAWWDTGARTLRRAELAAVDFTVAPNPNLKAEIPLPVEPTGEGAAPPAFDWREAIRRYGPRALGVVVALALFLRLFEARIGALHARWVERRRERAESESAHLEQVVHAGRSGRPAALLAATYRWLDRRGDARGVARLDRFAQQSGDPELLSVADSFIESALANEARPGTEDVEKRFVDVLVRTARRRASTRPTPGALGPLNPRS